MDDKDHKQEYISVGELSTGFSEHILPATDNLASRKLQLHYESGKKGIITFTDAETLKWETKERGHKQSSTCSYRAIVPRTGIYFVDFVARDESRSVSVILDTDRKCAMTVTGIMPTAQEVMIPLIIRAEKGTPLTSVQAIFEHAAIDGPFTPKTPRHEKTEDLVGERIEWVYSSKDTYEHIYLNANTYTWHCIAGNEKGLADTDCCFFYKLAEALYLFVWIEKIIPTVGVVIEDLKVMRSYGKIFGHEGYDMNGPVTNFAVGSYGTLLNNLLQRGDL
jgi:hypothetical protein